MLRFECPEVKIAECRCADHVAKMLRKSGDARLQVISIRLGSEPPPYSVMSIPTQYAMWPLTNSCAKGSAGIA